MTMRTFAALIPVVLLSAVWLGICWTDIARRDQVRYLPRWAWALVCLASVPFGGIVYFLVGRKNT